MKRRDLIRTIAIITAGAALLPACKDKAKPGIVLKNIAVSEAEQEMLAALCDAIIPTTGNFPGAKELKSHEFVLKMIDDCNPPEKQQAFSTGLTAFDKLSHDQFGQIFKSYTAEQKKSLLANLEAQKNIPADAQQFYKTVKGYTLQSFTSSKQYMLDVRKYKMVPGSDFKGCVKA